MQINPPLKKALNLVRRGKYDQAIKMLEPEAFNYQDSFQYFNILGFACLYAGDNGGAFTYFNKARNIKFKETGPLLALAFLFLRRGDTKRAAGLYLDVQELNRKNKTARRALELLRRSGGEELSLWVQSKKARRLYPPLPGGRQVWRFFVPPLFALLAAALLGGGIMFTGKYLSRPKPERAGLEEVVLDHDEKSDAVETGAVYRYILTIDEVITCFNEARSFFNEYRDEKAKYNINRLLESNASVPVKNKARLLKSLTIPPKTPGDLKDHFSYAEVRKEPALFNGCYVNWKGMAANVLIEEKVMSFDFLAGYDPQGGVWDGGAIRVEASFADEFDSKAPLEVFGWIGIAPDKQNGFILEAIAIHPLEAPGR